MIQIVFAKWGTAAYGASDVNRLVRAIREHATEPVRFVCLTDRPDDTYDEGVETRPFPEFVLPFEEMKKGCRLKLAAFAPGLLNPDDPAILFDLDTMVCGDVARIAAAVRQRPRALFMMANHYVPFWRVQRYIRPLLGEYYYSGNASVVGFLPQNFSYLFEAFNRLAPPVGEPTPKHLSSDERVMSYGARDRTRVFPRKIVLKFAEEFMLPVLALETLRAKLPWVKARRRSPVAIVFVGPMLKPKVLAGYRTGQIVHYHFPARKVRWVFDFITDYWRKPVT